MTRALSWLAGAALVIAAGAVTAITPDADAQNGPFLIHGDVGQRLTSRNLVVTVDGAAFADRVTVDDEWAAEGNWLVVDLSASAATTEEDAQMRLVKLVVGGREFVVGGREFVASERPASSLVGEDLRVGLDTTGMVAFELPSDLTTGAAEMRFTLPYSTPHLDDVIVVPLDLGGLDHEKSIEIVEPSLPVAP